MVLNTIETGRHMRPLLTVREVARLLHVHENTVRRWSNNSILPFLRIGQRGDRRYHKDDIDNFMSLSEFYRKQI